MYNPITVVHIYPTLKFNADGVANVVRNLISEQVQSGCKVFYGNKEIKESQNDLNLNISWKTIFFSAISYLNYIIGKNFNYHKFYNKKIIHIHGLWSIKSFLLAHFERRDHDKVVLSPHGMMSNFSFSHKKVKKEIFHKFFQRYFLKKCDALIVTSVDEKNDVEKWLPNSYIQIIPNGVVLPTLNIDSSQEKNEIIYIGRIDPVKNIHLIIQAWSIVFRDFPNLSLRIIGKSNSSYYQSCVKIIEAEGIERVIFSPVLPFWRRFDAFKRALVTVLVSETENFGLVVGESLAAQVPVIVSSNLPWSGVATNKCGWIVNRSPRDVAEALRSAAKSSELDIAKMGERGRNWIESEFSWNRVTKMTLDVYRHA